MWLVAISIIAIIAIILSIVTLMKIKKEGYINYPFGPINPEMVNPFVTQSVYGQPGSMFNLATQQLGGADATLNTYQMQTEYVKDFVPEHIVNNGFNFGGNTTDALELSKLGAWDQL
jgi:hypothetical protein